MALWSKTDWAFWTACLTGKQEDFEAITAPIYTFFNEAERRTGLTDLYFTDKPDTALMHSRPVIGGIFIKMLYDKEVWKKWAARDKTQANGPWAPLPVPPVIKAVVSAATIQWRYTMEQPDDGWFQAKFEDKNWQKGRGGFGTKGTPGIEVKTKWNTSDIWLRGQVVIPEGTYENLKLNLYHDEDAEVYINNVLAATTGGYTTSYEPIPLVSSIKLQPGTFFFAIHCHQTNGGQGIDLQIVDVIKNSR